MLGGAGESGILAPESIDLPLLRSALLLQISDSLLLGANDRLVFGALRAQL